MDQKSYTDSQIDEIQGNYAQYISLNATILTYLWPFERQIIDVNAVAAEQC